MAIKTVSRPPSRAAAPSTAAPSFVRTVSVHGRFFASSESGTFISSCGAFTSRTTTEPAPITARSPTFTPGRTEAWLPTSTPSPSTTPPVMST